MSRTDNSIKNMATSSFGELLSILLKFVTRSVFISALGTQYLGISGLFTNILSMLALTELGIGSAITFNLYKPIAMKDEKKLSSLMWFYKGTYRVIGLTVALLGFAILPFLPYIIKDDLGLININLIFLIYLMQSVSSYLFFAYKGALIKAHQKEYTITVLGYYFSIGTSVVQIVLLQVFQNFTLYVFTVVMSTILRNLVVAYKANRMYPYIRKKPEEKLDRSEGVKIFKDSLAIMIYRVNAVVLNATDNIVLSKFIGLSIVGVYSNYLLIFTTIKLFLAKFYQGITASLGNLHASENPEREYAIFKVLNFFTIYIHGIAATGTFVVANAFMTAWIGEEFTLSQLFVLLLSMEIYISGLQKNLATFRTTMGLFQQAKYRPIFSIIINLVLSIYLVQHIGIYGVLIGTIVANMTTVMWFDPLVIYKHGFHRSVLPYYWANVKYALGVSFVAAFTYGVGMLLPLEGYARFFVLGTLSVVHTMAYMHIVYRKTAEYRYMLDTLQQVRKKLARRMRRF